MPAFTGSLAFADPVPAGTKLEIRLQTPHSSYETQKGTKISGVLVAPVTESGDYAASSRNDRRRFRGVGAEGGHGGCSRDGADSTAVRPCGFIRWRERSAAMPHHGSGECRNLWMRRAAFKEYARPPL